MSSSHNPAFAYDFTGTCNSTPPNSLYVHRPRVIRGTSADTADYSQLDFIAIYPLRTIRPEPTFHSTNCQYQKCPKCSSIHSRDQILTKYSKVKKGYRAHHNTSFLDKSIISYVKLRQSLMSTLSAKLVDLDIPGDFPRPAPVFLIVLCRRHGGRRGRRGSRFAGPRCRAAATGGPGHQLEPLSPRRARRAA